MKMGLWKFFRSSHHTSYKETCLTSHPVVNTVAESHRGTRAKDIKSESIIQGKGSLATQCKSFTKTRTRSTEPTPTQYQLTSGGGGKCRTIDIVASSSSFSSSSSSSSSNLKSQCSSSSTSQCMPKLSNNSMISSSGKSCINRRSDSGGKLCVADDMLQRNSRQTFLGQKWQERRSNLPPRFEANKKCESIRTQEQSMNGSYGKDESFRQSTQCFGSSRQIKTMWSLLKSIKSHKRSNSVYSGCTAASTVSQISSGMSETEVMSDFSSQESPCFVSPGGDIDHTPQKLLLPIPIRRTIQDGPRGPVVPSVSKPEIEILNTVGLTPAAWAPSYLQEVAFGTHSVEIELDELADEETLVAGFDG